MFFPPSFFPASRKGYNNYLKSLGINPKDQTSILFAAIPFEQFKTLERRSIDEKIKEAGDEAARLHDVWIDALKDGRKADAGFAYAGHCRKTREYIYLIEIKEKGLKNTKPTNE